MPTLEVSMDYITPTGEIAEYLRAWMEEFMVDPVRAQPLPENHFEPWVRFVFATTRDRDIFRLYWCD